MLRKRHRLSDLDPKRPEELFEEDVVIYEDEFGSPSCFEEVEEAEENMDGSLSDDAAAHFNDNVYDEEDENYEDDQYTSENGINCNTIRKKAIGYLGFRGKLDKSKSHGKSGKLLKRKLDFFSDSSLGKKFCKSEFVDDEDSNSQNDYENYSSESPECQLNIPRQIKPIVTPCPPEMQSWLDKFEEWSSSDRLAALDRLIAVCEPAQVRHMMNVIEPQFQRDFISLLPKESYFPTLAFSHSKPLAGAILSAPISPPTRQDDFLFLIEREELIDMPKILPPEIELGLINQCLNKLALYVLSFLEPKDLLKAAQTCRYWRVLAEDNLLWREKCYEEGIDDVRKVLGRPRKRSTGTANPPSLALKNKWKAAYMKQHNIEMNWRYNGIKLPLVLKGHDDHVITCLQFSGNRIVSGSDDNTLKVWSAISGKCLRTLVGHTGGVWSSQMWHNVIISGSTDRTLKVWNADTGQCIHTLYGHTSTVRCMHLHENKVVSGSRDATLRVWDVDTGKCLHVLVGHVAAVRCVQYNGKLVVSGAYDYMVKVWNPEKEECIHTLQGHTNRVYSLQFDGVHVVSGSLDTSIRVWDVETGACKHTLMGHQSLTSGMELRNNTLVSGNADSTVKVWDITSGQCLQTLAGAHKHQSAVTSLQFNSKFVITSSDDGTVKLWDLKTGEFLRNIVALESGGSGGVVWRIRASSTKLICAVGSRNGTEETKLLVLDFDCDM